MTPMTDLERQLAAWLDEDGPVGVASGVVDAALARAMGERQRPPWLVREWWRPRRTRPAWPVAEDEALAADIAVGVPTVPIFRPPVRLAWVMVALLALLALFGGLLGAGGWLRATTIGGFACPAGSDPDAPGPAGQARPPGGGTWLAEWAGGGEIVVLTRTGPPWMFDVCTNTWRAPQDSGPPTYPASPDPAGPWDGTLVYDQGSGLLVAFSSSGVWVRDGNGSWTLRGARSRDVKQAAYDPGSGLIITAAGRRFMWTYDTDTDTWHDIGQVGPTPATGGGGGYQLVTYDTAAARLVLLDGSRTYMTWLFDPLTSTWTETMAPVPVRLFIETDEITYDTAAGRTLVYAEDKVFAHDVVNSDWDVLFDGTADGAAPPWQGAGMAWDPVHERLVVLGGIVDGTVDPWAMTDGVSAFDPETRTWTELLAPSAGGAP